VTNEVAFLLGTATTAAAQILYVCFHRFTIRLHRDLEEFVAERDDLVSRTTAEIRSMRAEMHTLNEDLARYLANRSKRG
jgi:hypothetical protein